MHYQKRKSKREQLVKEYGSRCWWCGVELSKKQLTLDHLKPKSLGGSHSLENLRLACRKCNASRGNSLYPPHPYSQNQHI
jgi:5-methylcytosine-specific restriction endonuclease McrA